MTSVNVSSLSVQAINKLVMHTEDVALLTTWLEEEREGLKRKSALHRIHHRLNLLRGRQELAELEKISREE